MTEKPEKIIYTAVATASGGRSGRAKSNDGVIDLALATPKEMGGPGDATNPEQLFAAGYSSCFSGALALVAKEKGVDISDSRVTAHVGFGPEGRSFAIAVTMEVKIPGQDEGSVRELTEAAHEVCPYSKATRGNVEVTLKPVAA